MQIINVEDKMEKKKEEKNKRKFNEKGITLIALVVTIVVLLILAGISINLVLGENGIIKKVLGYYLELKIRQPKIKRCHYV